MKPWGKYSRSDAKVLRSEAIRSIPPSMAPPPPVIPDFADFDDAVLGTGEGQHSFSGNWPIFDSATDYLIGHHYTTETGATDTFRFFGRQYQLFDTIGPGGGIAGITNDTAAEVGIDQYQATVYSDNTLVYTSPDLGLGVHTFIKRNTGTRNAASGGNEVSSDRVRVWQTFAQTPTTTVIIPGNPPPEPPPPAPPPEPPPPEIVNIDNASVGTGRDQVEFVGGPWQVFNDATNFAGSRSFTNDPNAYYQIRFYGRQARKYVTVGPDHGIVAVSWDGGTEADLDLFQAGTYEQKRVLTSPTFGLGDHILKVRNTGRRNAGSADSHGVCDVLEVRQTAVADAIPDPDPLPPPPVGISRPQVVGRYVRNASGQTLRLRGVSGIFVRDQENFREGINQFIDRHTNVGAGWYSKFYRIPVNPGAYLANPTAYIVYIDKMVAKCKAVELYCVIDWHDFGRVTTDSGALSDYSTVGASGAPQYGGQKARTETFWSVIAPRYKNETHVMYEVFNEPIQVNQTGGVQATWDRWRTQVQPTVNMIRGLAPDTIIMVGGPQYSQWIGGAVSNPIQGTNIAYVWHGYPGAYYPDANGNNQLNRTGWTIHAGVTAERYPVFVTEYGYGFGTPAETSGEKSTYFDPFIIFLEDYLMHSTAWNADFDYYPEMYAGSSYAVLSEFGQAVKDYLFARRNG